MLPVIVVFISLRMRDQDTRDAGVSDAWLASDNVQGVPKQKFLFESTMWGK